MSGTLSFDVTFSANVTGLTASAFDVYTSGGSAVSKTLVGSGRSYTLHAELPPCVSVCPSGYATGDGPDGTLLCAKRMAGMMTFTTAQAACAPYDLVSVLSEEHQAFYESLIPAGGHSWYGTSPHPRCGVLCGVPRVCLVCDGHVVAAGLGLREWAAMAMRTRTTGQMARPAAATPTGCLVNPPPLPPTAAGCWTMACGSMTRVPPRQARCVPPRGVGTTSLCPSPKPRRVCRLVTWGPPSEAWSTGRRLIQRSPWTANRWHARPTSWRSSSTTPVTPPACRLVTSLCPPVISASRASSWCRCPRPGTA